MSPAPDVMTVAQAADYLQVGVKVVRRLCRLNRLPHRVVDRKGSVRIHRAAIDAYLRHEKSSS